MLKYTNPKWVIKIHCQLSDTFVHNETLLKCILQERTTRRAGYLPEYFFRRLGYLPALTHHTMCIAFLSCNYIKCITTQYIYLLFCSYKSILLKITVCPFIDIFSTLYPYSVSSFFYFKKEWSIGIPAIC